MKKEDISNLKKRIRNEFEKISDLTGLEKLRQEFLGKKGALTVLLRSLKDVAQSEKAQIGKALNKIKEEFETFCSSKIEEYSKASVEKEIKSKLIDATLPGVPVYIGSTHPLSQIIQEIILIFSRLGFVCADGPEIETDYNNFEALNFPNEHPARDEHDTFYLNINDNKGKPFIMRTHTSPVQIRVMKAHKPPLRILVPGRVFRHEATDATHSYMFHQVEGLAIDTNINFADLKGNLNIFAQQMFGKEIKTRFRPGFFPFTEPSAEMDIVCIFCKGSGCRVCKSTGWLEIMGSGMVHPHVLTAVGYDAEKYIGYAFGMGVERIAMLKYGINDMRLFFENDNRFLRQF
ncbi:MAG: phenylalanine--tRNA ligase subunit alpha [bacterium]